MFEIDEARKITALCSEELKAKFDKKALELGLSPTKLIEKLLGGDESNRTSDCQEEAEDINEIKNLLEGLVSKVDIAIEIGNAGSESDVVSKALEFYFANQGNQHIEQTSKSNLSHEPQEWFVTSKAENKLEIREALKIESADIVMSEFELLQKASELSEISIEEIERQGRQLLAQKLITQNAKSSKTNKSGNGQGVAGGADQRLDEAYEQLKQMVASGAYKPKGGRLTLTAVSSRAMSNYNTSRSWADRKGYTELLIDNAENGGTCLKK